LRNRTTLVSTLFLVSGATGLLYEVAFSKLLAYVFGATAYAVSTVLASFMGGLALGAFLGGRFAARARRPLVVYGALELVVGAVCAASPAALGFVTDAYVGLARSMPGSLAALTAVRFALTAVVVVVPTVAMGATLPVLSRVIAGRGAGDDARLSRLYAINTAGGAAGALASAYAILPMLGVRGTMAAAALANVAIGVTAAFVGRGDVAPAIDEPVSGVAASPSPTEEADADARLWLGLAFASGFLVFAAEVVETHLLALLIGNSAYAFGLMLAVFLVCLAFGASRAARFSARHGELALARGLVVAAIAMAVTLPLWDQLPRIFIGVGARVTSFHGREACRALAAFAILALPTYWMGTTFPLLLGRIAGRRDVAAAVGRLTVANTIGTIFGSILTGYFLLPTLGSQGSLRAVAAGFAASAFVAAWAARGRVASSSGGRLYAFAAAAAVLALVAPSWNLARLTNGSNVYFWGRPAPDKIEFAREDVHGGFTSVETLGGVHTLLTNGKFQGDDGFEMTAQRRFAHFPSMFVDRWENALVIGLGTGTTLGTISSYPWKHIDVAEISPAIVEAAHTYFKGPNRGALDDPRVHLYLNDGRNQLLVSTTSYDLITMELSSVWFAGAASLYSKEFYELARARLTPTGVLQQWVQLHHIRRQELAVIVRTLRASFPHVALFVGGAQGILVASGRPLVASRENLAKLAVRPAIVETLGGASFDDVLAELVTSEADLDRFVAESDAPSLLSTDDNLYLEYATPKGNVFDYKASLDQAVATLRRYAPADVAARHLGP
jgi:spermidine synthase